ncbi:MAG: insulinase family protein [Acidobacteriota bacterium]|nr:insulinase family protein [Acidobacteriota bacterium]
MGNCMGNLQTNLKPLSALLVITLLALSPTSVLAQTQQIPAHPRELKYTTMTFTPPKREQYRHVLSNGVVAYLVEDHDLPLVNISTLVRTGSYLDPVDKEGLAALTGAQMRAGGTTSKTAEEFDEAADFLAALISSNIGPLQGIASLNLLTKDIDPGLALYFDMLKNPRFQEDRIKLAKSQILQTMERRNDSTTTIENREWSRLMYGANHFSAKQATKASIERLTREDMLAFHQRYYQPGGLMMAVSGDFNTKEMVAKLDAAMKGWPVSKQPPPVVPKTPYVSVAGVYAVHKPDVNQGRVSIGHIGAMRDNPDSYALTIMNDILGGGGFTSRITSRVRSDEGLAYSAGSSFGFGVYNPGIFRASFQSKNATTSQAIDITMEEINRLRTGKVTAEELETARNYAIEVFPRNFATAAQVANIYAQDEFTKRAPDYWTTYRDRIRAITADDVQRVAQKYLQPDKLVVLVVGNIDEISKGNPDKPQYSLLKIAKDGQIRRIPLPDPLTLIYSSSP